MLSADLKSLLAITSKNFHDIALDVFKYQSKFNPVYAKFIQLLGVKTSQVKTTGQIPFLPIEFFKTHKIKTGNWKPQTLFRSSGTTGEPSIHYVRDLSYYQEVSASIFRKFFGDLKEFEIYALLPGYQDSPDNSLIHMITHFVKQTDSHNSGFYLGKEERLKQLLENPSRHKKKLLFGVSHALLDFANNFNLKLGKTIVMETGGMKGRKREITRKELHELLGKKLGVREVFSEFGMAELTSQGYSMGKGNFRFPPWVEIQIREVSNPFARVTNGRAGGINVIDLSNINTCSFIETKDLGRVKKGQKVEILGRFDNSDVRGCNLLVR